MISKNSAFGLKEEDRGFYQELILAPHLSVAENLYLGREDRAVRRGRSRCAENRPNTGDPTNFLKLVAAHGREE